MVKLIEPDRDFLISELLRFKEENGKIPRSYDMLKCNGYPYYGRYFKAFGSWNDIIKRVFYNEEYMISDLLRFEEKNGRVPLYEEITRENGFISRNKYIEIFGSWLNALRKTPFKTRIDEYFFSLENMDLRKWYIVGYIIGDGYVADNLMSITTTEKDKENLYDMHQYMNLGTNILTEERDGCQTQYRLTKKCKQWVDDLALYGIVPRKSLISYIPLDYLKTSEEEAAIMKGIFDSDGSIIYYGLSNLYPAFSIIGAEQLCKDYVYLLKKNCNISCNIKKHGSVFRIQINGIEKCQKIYDFLYGHDNFYIKRKKERFEKLLNGTFTLGDNY